ncbi:MAG: AraC family transcriptional regulator [Candidatus Chryseobacterium colombiense]|nr:AraC family transcriptional regulator [Chryseobacterium sp.]WEK71200.1 MAG: AraC family transcriptional regulator [Chryseobacterium sp.]
MKVSYESILPDKNCSFRILHNNVPVKELKWEYHYHPEIELICVISGSGTRHVGYNKSNFRNGDLVLIGSNIPHSGFGINSLDPHEEIVVQFREEIIALPREVEEISGLRKLITLSQFGILFSSKVKRKYLPKLVQLLEAENSKRYPLLLNLLFELADEKDYVLLNKEVMPHTIISKHKERLQVIFTFLEKNYDKQIDINEVADLANLTLPAFCNFFKKATKLTFSDFVNQYRMEKACTLLLEGKSITEACYSTGYSSISYFGRTFKKYMGKTPTEFNKELNK